MKRFKIRFYGRVQGVGFRYTAYNLANDLGLTGWVENEYDGTVLCEVQGERSVIDKFLEKLHHGRFIRIDDMDIKEISPDENERSFEYGY